MPTSKAVFALGLLAMLAGGVWLKGEPQPGASASFPASFPAPTSTMRPWTRWWWLGNAVDEKGIDRMLGQFAAAGEGGVEITPIYGAKGYESHFLRYLSPDWVRMVAHTTEEAKRLGLGVDLTTGTGWPMGGPWITKDLASQGIKIHAPAAGGGVYSVDVKKAVQRVKRAAPGGEGYVINPFSIPSLEAFLGGIDKGFAGYTGLPPRAQFHDSYEYYGAEWSPDFLAQFERRRGYKLDEHYEALAGAGDPDIASRVRADYRLTLSDLHREWVARWTAWSHDHGSLSREQAHGAPANIEDVYAEADIPETEGDFGGGTDLQVPMMKLSSSAAHAKGTTLASSETFTWLGEHFQVALFDMKPVVDRFFLSGVNHLFFHGSPYSPEEVPWPGWVFYAASNYGPNGSFWHDLPAFNGYATRCQSILQSGRPDEDVLLYFPFSDFIQTPVAPADGSDSLLVQFKTPGLWMNGSAYHKAAMKLWSQGYGYDSITDELLKLVTVSNGGLALGGNHYRVIVVPDCRTMPVDTLQALAALSHAGAKVVFLGAIPSDVPGFKDLEHRRSELRQIGKEFVGAQVNADIASIGVRREAMTDLGAHYLRRVSDSGDTSYFIVNDSKKDLDGWVPLASDGDYAELLDPLAGGDAGRAAFRLHDGHPAVYLQLKPDASIVVVLRKHVGPIPVNEPFWKYLRAPSVEARMLEGDWSVQFLEGGPVLPADFTSKGPQYWTERSDPEAARFSGTARYATSVTLDPSEGADWVLDLPSLADSAQVRVNGTLVGTVWCKPFQINVGRYLRPGANRIEIDVTNVGANRIRDLDRRHVSWKSFYEINFVNKDYEKFDASAWAIRPAGLSRGVSLTPVGALVPAQ